MKKMRPVASVNLISEETVSGAAQAMMLPRWGAYCCGNTGYTRPLVKLAEGCITYKNTDCLRFYGNRDREAGDLLQELADDLENNKVYALSDCKSAGDSFTYRKKLKGGQCDILFLKADRGVTGALVYLENAAGDDGLRICAFLIYSVAVLKNDRELESAASRYCMFKLGMPDLCGYKALLDIKEPDEDQEEGD